MLKFSIIIPTRNRSESLMQVLKALANIDFEKKNFEVIVVDNGSTDNTKKSTQIFNKENPRLKSKYVLERRIGPSYARNLGIKIAKYQNIVCIDDDVLAPKNLLIKYSELLKKHPNLALASGKTIAVSNDKKAILKWINLLGEDKWVLAEIGNNLKGIKLLDENDQFISANILINRKLIKGKVFNEKLGRMYGSWLIFGEDTELGLRAIRNKMKIVYDPSIVSKHLIPPSKLTYRYVLSRFFRAGMEHRLLDNTINSDTEKYYRINWKSKVKTLLLFLTNPFKIKWLKLLREVLFFLGYYFLPLIAL